MTMADSRHQLGINDKDLVVMKSRNGMNWLLLAIGSIVTAVASFAAGYAVSRENPGYPYSSIGVAALAAVGKKRFSWAAALLLALVAVFFLNFGVFAARPTMGEGSFYGVYSRRT